MQEDSSLSFLDNHPIFDGLMAILLMKDIFIKSIKW